MMDLNIKDTQLGINSGGSPNDNMASDFSTPQFHAINDVSLYHVWFANTIVAYMFFTCKQNRENDLYTLFCGLHKIICL